MILQGSAAGLPGLGLSKASCQSCLDNPRGCLPSRILAHGYHTLQVRYTVGDRAFQLLFAAVYTGERVLARLSHGSCPPASYAPCAACTLGPFTCLSLPPAPGWHMHPHYPPAAPQLITSSHPCLLLNALFNSPPQQHRNRPTNTAKLTQATLHTRPCSPCPLQLPTPLFLASCGPPAPPSPWPWP